MKPDTIKLPWAQIGLTIGKLVRSARGGIDKAEAEDLLGDLADIITYITLQIGNG
jgi:hypothetical protein